MSRTPARFTQADLNRAAKAAALNGWRVRLTVAGEIVLEPRDGIETPARVLSTGEDPPVDERPPYVF